MIFYDVEQNTPEWIALRLGRVCSSDFDKVMTPKERKLSKTSVKLMYRLLAEWITGAPVENSEENRTEWMERGQDLEDAAVRCYEGLAEVETTRGGFCTDDTGMLGCSRDRAIVGVKAGLEIKAPLIHTQVGYALGSPVDDAYMTQLQGQMMIAEMDWVDIFSYHPALVIPAIRVVRDEKYIADLRSTLTAFVDVMLQSRVILEREFGPFVRPEFVAPKDVSKDWLNESDVEDYLASIGKQ